MKGGTIRKIIWQFLCLYFILMHVLPVLTMSSGIIPIQIMTV